MNDHSAMLELAAAVGRSIIDAENKFLEGYGIDANEHIPRLRRIAEAAGAAAERAGLGKQQAEEITRGLLGYAEQEYIKTWMSQIEEEDSDEDPDEVREDGLRVFRHVLAGGFR